MRILLAEQSDLICEMCLIVLKDFQCDSCNSLADAIAFLSYHDYDLILVCMELPDSNSSTSICQTGRGVHMLRKISNKPMLILTSNIHSIIDLSAEDLHNVSILEKPFQIQDLLDSISRLSAQLTA